MAELDPKASVFGGAAGSGDAFILGNGWEKPLEIGLMADKENQARVAAEKAAKEKEDKEAQERLLKYGSIDTSKAWDVDIPGFMEESKSMIAEAGSKIAQGVDITNPMKNPNEWAESRNREDNLKSRVAMSQQQADHAKQLATLVATNPGKYNTREFEARLEAWKKLPVEERAKKMLDLDGLVNLNGVVNEQLSKMRALMKKDTDVTGNWARNEKTVTSQFTPDQLEAVARAAVETPGMVQDAGKLLSAIKNNDLASYTGSLPVTPQALELAKNAFGADDFALDLARDQAQRVAEKQVEKDVRFNQFPPQRQTEASQGNKNDEAQAITYIKEIKDLMYNPAKYDQVSDEYFKIHNGQKVFLRKTDAFANNALGKDNNILNFYYDPMAKQAYVVTKASKNAAPNDMERQLIPLTNKNVLSDIMRTHFTGDYKGKPGVLDRVLQNDLRPGTGAELNWSAPADYTRPQEQQQAKTVQVTTQRRQINHDVDNNLTKAAEEAATSGDQNKLAGAYTAVNSWLKNGTLYRGGAKLANPEARFFIQKPLVGKNTVMVNLYYDKYNEKTKKYTRVEDPDPITLDEFKSLMKSEDQANGFVLTKAGIKRISGQAGAAPAAPAPVAQAAPPAAAKAKTSKPPRAKAGNGKISKNAADDL